MDLTVLGEAPVQTSGAKKEIRSGSEEKRPLPNPFEAEKGKTK